MAKYRFTRKHRDHHKGKVVEGMRIDRKTVMVKTPYNTGFIYTFEPVFLGSKQLLIKVK